MSTTPMIDSGIARVNKKEWGKDAGSFVVMAPSGRAVNPLDLQVEDILFEDIALSLSNECRFGGKTDPFYSVAEHSVRVARWVKEKGGSPEDEQWALIHDAAEAYLRDMARPLKADPYFGRAHRGAEAKAMSVICERLGIEKKQPAIVGDGDVALFTAERRDLMPRSELWDLWSVPIELDVPQEKICPWTGPRARKEWLRQFIRLFGPGSIEPLL